MIYKKYLHFWTPGEAVSSWALILIISRTNTNKKWKIKNYKRARLSKNKRRTNTDSNFAYDYWMIMIELNKSYWALRNIKNITQQTLTLLTALHAVTFSENKSVLAVKEKQGKKWNTLFSSSVCFEKYCFFYIYLDKWNISTRSEMIYCIKLYCVTDSENYTILYHIVIQYYQ